MSILRPALQFAQSLPVVAPQRRNTLAQSGFYQQQQQGSQPPVDPNSQQMTTEDFITQQLNNIKNKPAVPRLDPSARVKNVDPSIADPSNFQGFYNQLNSITQIGQEQLATAQAQSALARLRSSQALGGSSGGGSNANAGGNYGSASANPVPSNPRANFQFAQNIAGNYGWSSPSELAAWYQLGMNESGWNNNAQNPTSTAYGIGQFLNSTWGGYGIPKTSDPALQVEAMARYIKARYGSPSRALAAWNSRSPHWY